LRAAALLEGSALEIAPRLLGATFLHEGVGGRIVEVEAYLPTDPASHAFRGRTPRNASMFAGPGTLYVYRSYGIHWCANVVCEPEGVGAAVLLRAVEPTHGLEEMRERRGPVAHRALCAGPGRLTQALGITGAADGRSLLEAPFQLEPAPAPVSYVTTPRIGISRAEEEPWRFVVRETRWASRGPRSASP
jgi:DNA-3-methyladenine glycosylase